MLRINTIHIEREEQSNVSLSSIQRIMKKMLKKVASSTEFRIVPNSIEVNVFLHKPISLQTVNRIFLEFSEEKIKIKRVIWSQEEIGVFEQGNLEVIVS